MRYSTDSAVAQKTGTKIVQAGGLKWNNQAELQTQRVFREHKIITDCKSHHSPMTPFCTYSAASVRGGVRYKEPAALFCTRRPRTRRTV